MNIRRAKEEIKNTIAAYLKKDEDGEYVIPAIRQRPLLLMGPPGIGKTQIMEQIARECRVGLVSYTITHHTRQSAVGLPFIEKKDYGGIAYTVTEYTMSEIIAAVYNRMEETGVTEGLLFIDEINCVSETLAPTMLQLLQCKTFGSHKLPEGWILVAAGNPPEYNKSVREFDVVTLDRIRMIEVRPDFGVWKEYAAEQGIHPAVTAYLDIKPQYFCQVETTVDGKRFATPRGWEDLSELLLVYESLEKVPDRELIGEYIQHPAISKDFANYLELYYKYQNAYQVDEILSGVIREELADRMGRAPFDERMSVTGLLLSKLCDGFKALFANKRLMELFMNELKGCRGALYEEGREGSAVLRAAADALDARRRKESKAGFLSREENTILRRCGALLERYAKGLALSSPAGGAESWDYICAEFLTLSDAYEEEKAACGEKLEHAFDFLEAAFGASQEMVIFITGLNRSRAAVEFLRDYDCARYYEYNKNLLFDRMEKDLLERVQGPA